MFPVLHNPFREIDFLYFKTVGRYSGFRIFLLITPSRLITTSQWPIVIFVPDYSGGTASVFHGLPC